MTVQNSESPKLERTNKQIQIRKRTPLWTALLATLLLEVQPSDGE